MSPKILRHDNIAISGDLGHGRNRKDLSRWISYNGGTLSPHITPQVTHLIASKEHWKKGLGLVPEALKHNHIYIVSIDWLENSLVYKQHLETEYLWSRVQAKKQEEQKVKKSERKQVLQIEENRFNEGLEAAKIDLFTDAHHIYRDDTTFQYRIRLTRPNLTTNIHESIDLTLYESSLSPPHLYATTLVYHGMGQNCLYADNTTLSRSRSKTYVLAPMGSDFERAFYAFRCGFHVFVGVDWHLRAWASMPQGLSAQAPPGARKVTSNHGLVGPQDETNTSVDASKENRDGPCFYTYQLPDVTKGEAFGDIVPRGMWRRFVERFGEPPTTTVARGKNSATCGGHKVVSGRTAENQGGH